MDSTSPPPLLLHGWYVLHQLFRSAGGSDIPAWSDETAEGWSATYRLIGGEPDLLLLHLRSTPEALADVEDRVRPWADDAGLEPAGSYLSVVELGLYTATLRAVEAATGAGIRYGSPEWKEIAADLLAEEGGKRHVQERLHPRPPPAFSWISVYPMNRRRVAPDNWYLLPLEERTALMAHHGEAGRRFAGRLSQVISGGTGISDWEWVVTLFASDPLVFKEVVTEMRYMESTARYGEFGPFHLGFRITDPPGGTHTGR